MNEDIANKSRIVKLLNKLPSSELTSLVQTKEQLDHWLNCRNSQKLVALAWEARFTGKNDPLKPLLRSRSIDLTTYNLVWYCVDYYEQLWNLVQLAQPDLEADLKRLGIEFPFESALELFAAIISSQINHAFLVCLKPYYEISKGKYENKFCLAEKWCKQDINLIEKGVLKGLLAQHSPVVWDINLIWLPLMLIICHSKVGKTSSPLKAKLEDYYKAMGRVSKTLATSCRKQEASFAWINGKRVKASRYGGTYHDA